jgi:hypothetical protein
LISMSEREPNRIPDKPDAPDEPHDVLAAEEFPGPSPEAAIVEQGPIELPGDPDGDSEPHDVLAAEQFAMPAPRHHGTTSVEVAPPPSGSAKTPLLVGAAAAALGALGVVLKLRSRRRSKLAQLRDRLPL